MTRTNSCRCYSTGGYRRREPIGGDGQAYFPEIPANFQGQEVPVSVESDAFEASDPKEKYRLDGSSIYLAVRKRAGHIVGHVQDANGNSIAAAKIDVAGLSKLTDSDGNFDFLIPGDRLQPELDLTASATGYRTKHYKAVQNSNPLVIQLARAP